MRSCHPGIICERLEPRNRPGAAAVPQALQDGSDDNQENVPDITPGEETQSDTGLPEGNETGEPQDLAEVFENDLNVVLVSSALDHIEGISDAADGETIVVYDEDNDNLDSIADILERLADTSRQSIASIALLSPW